jgi:hypothetical protein
MKAKTINAVIKKKVDEWLASIEDEAVRDAAKFNVVVTGGCIASMMLREPVNDYDIYFRTREAATAVAKYYIARFQPRSVNGIPCKISLWESDDRIKVMIKSAGIASENGTDKAYEYFEARPEGEAGDYVGDVMRDPADIVDAAEEAQDKAREAEEAAKPKYRPVFMSTNAITLSGKIQLILRFWGNPDEIHTNYDYVHATNYWTSWGSGTNHLELRKEALESLLARELRYVGSKYPICSVIRMRKFIKRGWTINAGQVLKMAMQISQLDLTSVEVLEDQLTGVDVAYFHEVIEKVRADDPTKINRAYLIEVIDRMF